MASIRRIVLDVLKPHEPSMIEFAERIEAVEGVEGVNGVLLEIDEDVQNIKFTVEGESFKFEEIKSALEEMGGSIHSVDEIACGSRLVEKVSTPQD